MVKKTSKVPFIVQVLASLVFLMGIIDIWSAVNPGMPQRIAILRPIFPYLIRSVLRLGTLLAGLFLIYLSNGLRNGKQTAWLMSMMILLSTLVFHIFKGFDIEEFSIAFILILLLLFERKRFTARPDIPSVFQGIRVLLVSFMLTSVYGIFGLYILEGRHGGQTFVQIFNNVTKMFFLVSSINSTHTILVSVFINSIYIVGFSSLLFSLYMLFRPVIYRSKANILEIRKVKEILFKYSISSLHNNLQLFGRHYFFGSAKEAFIAYKDSGGYSLVLGSPVGNNVEIDLIIKEFIDFCFKQGRKPVYCSIEEENLPLFEKYGFKSLNIGSEAFIDPNTFTIEGGKAKHLRQALKKMDNLGYTTKVYSGADIYQVLWRLRNVSREWLTYMHGSEKLFTDGRFDEKYLLTSKIIVVTDKSGHISAFVNFNNYGKNSMIVDLMRHEKDALSETMLYIFLKLFYWAKNNGYETISLGNASLYRVGESGSSFAEKTFKLVFHRFNNFYNFKGLYVFKSKFDPKWEPRFLVYPTQGDLVPALSALLAADSSSSLTKDLFKEINKSINKK